VFNRREVEEFEELLADQGRRRACWCSSITGSSSAGASSSRASSSGAPPPRVKLEPVKLEPGELAGAGADPPRRGVIGPEDFVVTDFDAVAAAIAERSLREEEERRRHEEELDALVVQQAVVANLTAKEKHDEWQRIGKEQASKYVDLVSSDED
jgi:hypothetical protein